MGVKLNNIFFSGKTTAVRVLKDPFQFIGTCPLFSQTGRAYTTSFMVAAPGVGSNGRGGDSFYLNIIDTPGLFERSAVEGVARRNEVIKELILECLQMEFATLHTLFFVCAFDEGILKEDVETIIDLNQILQGAGKAVSLLVTRCEKKNKKKRVQLEAEIRAIPELKEFFADPQVKVFFTGALPFDDYESGMFESVRISIENILEMRADIYQHIFNSAEGCPLMDLEVVQAQAREFAELRKEIGVLIEDILSSPAQQKPKFQWHLIHRVRLLRPLLRLLSVIAEEDNDQQLKLEIAATRRLLKQARSVGNEQDDVKE